MSFDPIRSYRAARAKSVKATDESFHRRAEAQMRKRAHTAFLSNGGTAQEFESHWPQLRERLLIETTVEIAKKGQR